jgi:hypothetical protein
VPCHLHRDYEERHARQWFYFAVHCSAPSTQPYRLNIVNFSKPGSAYNLGQQPLLWWAGPPAQAPAAAARCTAGAATCPGAAMEVCEGYWPPGRSGGRGGAVWQGAADSALPARSWLRAGSSICYHPSPYQVLVQEQQAEGMGQGSSGGGSSSQSDKRAAAPGCKGIRSKGKASRKVSKSCAAGSCSKAASGADRACHPGSALSSSSAADAAYMAQADDKAGEGSEDLAGGERQVAGRAGVAPGAAGTGLLARRTLYCLSFDLLLPHAGTYFLASCYPYSWPDLQGQLAQLPGQRQQQQQEEKEKEEAAAASTATGRATCSAEGSAPEGGGGEVSVQRSVLCVSLAGVPLDLLTISSAPAAAEAAEPAAGAEAVAGAGPEAQACVKPAVVLTARVHPGETCGSWVMQVGYAVHCCQCISPLSRSMALPCPACLDSATQA